MKEVTLKFREIAVDGLPQESMSCVVVCNYGTDVRPQTLPFSINHGAFNTRDWYSVEQTSQYVINNVTHWMPLHEFFVAIKGEQNENLD